MCSNSEGWLWCIDNNGNPYYFVIRETPESDDDIKWNSATIGDRQCRNVAVSKIAAYCVDTEGAVHIFVRPSHTVLRRRVAVYFNQRWYPVIGWSQTLPTDRNELSTSDGNTYDTNIVLPSSGWRWEDPWMVHSDPALTDKEGFEYAFNFTSSTWSRSKKKCFVRRRMLKRYMRYIAYNQWVTFADSGPRFLSLSVGSGFGTKTNEFLLFGLAEDGIVYLRSSVSELHPEGSCWVPLDRIINTDGDTEDITSICCSPTVPALLALTWEGHLYARGSMTDDFPGGFLWVRVNTPNNLSVIEASLGASSLWCVSVEGQIWRCGLEKSMDAKEIKPSSYCQVSSSMSRISVSASDHLFCISSATETIHLRSGITTDEPTGRSFLPLIERTGSDPQGWAQVCASASWGQPATWMTSVSYPTKVSNDRSFKQAAWRYQILGRLEEQDKKCWDVFKLKYPEDENPLDDKELCLRDEDQTKSRVEVFLWCSEWGWSASRGSAILSSDEILVKSGTASHSIARTQVLSVNEGFAPLVTRCAIALASRTRTELLSLVIAFETEDSRDKWFMRIHEWIRLEIVESVRDPKAPILWSVTNEIPCCHYGNQLVHDNRSGEMRPVRAEDVLSLTLPGRFQSVSVGAQRVVWALSKNSEPYALTADFDPLTGEECNDYLQTETVMFEVEEYQRRGLILGFVPFQGCQLGIFSWMYKGRQVSGKFNRVPSRYYTWTDTDWKVKIEENSDKDGWLYAEKLDRVYSEKSMKSTARRRIWQRKAEMSRKGPWIRVLSPRIKRLVLQKNDDSMMYVWVLTEEGQVLIRQGVTRMCPEGLAWKQVVCDYTISHLALASSRCAWAISKEGRVLKRNCADLLDMMSIEWELCAQVFHGVEMFVAALDNVWLVVRGTGLVLWKTQNGVILPTSRDFSGHLAVDRYGKAYMQEGLHVIRMGSWKMVMNVSKRRDLTQVVHDGFTVVSVGYMENFDIC